MILSNNIMWELLCWFDSSTFARKRLSVCRTFLGRIKLTVLCVLTGHFLEQLVVRLPVLNTLLPFLPTL